MTITLDEALSHLNIDEPTVGEQSEVELFVDAANEWIDERVSDSSPAPVRLAALFLISHLWETKRGPVSSQFDDDIVQVSGTAFAIPNRVLELLGPFLLDGTASPTYSFPDAVAHPDPVEWV